MLLQKDIHMALSSPLDPDINFTFAHTPLTIVFEVKNHSSSSMLFLLSTYHFQCMYVYIGVQIIHTLCHVSILFIACYPYSRWAEIFLFYLLLYKSSFLFHTNLYFPEISMVEYKGFKHFLRYSTKMLEWWLWWWCQTDILTHLILTTTQ